MDIPDKSIFSRSEVIRLVRLEGRVLDYWQKEFGGFLPVVNRGGEKLYTRTDLELIVKIKHWMVVERLARSLVKEKIKQEYGRGPGTAAVAAAGTGKQDTATETGIKPPQTGALNPAAYRKYRDEVKQVPQEKLKIIRRNLQEILTILDKNGK